MSEEEPTIKVRDRRRFKDAAGAAAEPATPTSETAEPVATGRETSESPAEPASSPTPGAESPSEPVTSGTSEAPSEGATPEAGATQPDEPDSSREATGFPEINVAGLLQFTLGTLVELAWQGLGLRMNPASGKVEAKLEEARLAIDAFAALLPVMGARMDDRSRRDLQTELSNLRLNYVEQVNRR